MADVLDDTRQPAKVGHDLLAVVRQRLFGLIAGYEDANDHTRLRHDPILQTVTNRDGKALASQPTLSRFENAVTARQAARGWSLVQAARAFLVEPDTRLG